LLYVRGDTAGGLTACGLVGGCDVGDTVPDGCCGD